MNLTRNSCRLIAHGLCSLFILVAAAHASAQATNDGWSEPGEAEGKPRERKPKPAPGVDHDRQAARALLDAGTIAYRQQRFEDALTNFQQAHKLTGDPLLLFNIGLVYERLLRLPEAVQTLEEYITALPDAPNRAAAEERIRVMKAHIEETAPPPPPPVETKVEEVAPPPPPPPAEPVDRGLRVLPTWAFWSGLGATVAVGGITVWSAIDTNGKHDDFNADPTPKNRDAGESAQLRTNVLIGVTGVFAVGTAVIGAVFTDWKGLGKETQTALTPHVDRHSAGLSFTHSF